MPDESSPIGVFDSGVGGLTVVRAIRNILPAESILYLGDTARVPYGTKSPETVVRYARNCVRTLLNRDVKLLVVACNTASAHALPALQEETGVPVLGVVEPGAQAAARRSKSGRIAVLGTRGTIESGEYQRALEECSDEIRSITRICPLFVPLAEEGLIAGAIPRLIAQEYLAGLSGEGVDTVLLGCTHYPLLAGTIQEVMGPGVSVVDSAAATANAVCDILAGLGMASEGRGDGGLHCLVSDAPERFTEIGTRFLGWPIEGVEWIDF